MLCQGFATAGSFFRTPRSELGGARIDAFVHLTKGLFLKIRSRFTILTVLLFSLQASASAVRGLSPGFNSINKGLVDVALDGLLILNQTSSATSSSFRATTSLGLTGQYFLIDNLSIGASISWLTVHNSTRLGVVDSSSSENGVLGLVHARYAIRTFSSLFVAPGVGVGGYWARRLVPITGSNFDATTLTGPAANASLDLVFYLSSAFNLRAGVKVLFRISNTGGETSYLTDVGVGAGVGLTF